jgi:CRP-like cAMP-binding protein
MLQTSRAAFLAGLPLLQGAAPAVLAEFAAQIRLVDAIAGQLIVDGEDATTDVYFLLRGKVRVALRTGGGNETILGDFAEGEFFGEMAAIDAAPRSARILALSRTRLAAVPAPAFLALIFSAPPVCHRLLRRLTERVRQGNQRLLEHATLPSRLRLQAELLRMAQPRSDGTLGISPPPTGADLASRIGVRREAVSRGLAMLARRGWTRAQRGVLVLQEPAAMRAAVEAGLAGEAT